MVPFGGWEMPVQYSSIMDEHHAVRQRAGLFDISHMGEVIVAGPNAEAVLNHLLTNDVSRVAVGQAQYSLLCNDAGGILDDLIFYRLEPTVFLLVVNASRIADDFVWLNTRANRSVVLDNISDRTAALALQGPQAAAFLPEAGTLRPFHVGTFPIAGTTCRVARTGYTGEDGFEILCDTGEAATLWNHFLDAGVTPCGLGARDTLRLEMGYPLYGQDITEQTTPLEAGLGRFVAFDKGDFIGREALRKQKDTGCARRLVAFKMTEKSPPPRPHYPLLAGTERVGEVTSGTLSPSLGTGIGMGYVTTDEKNLAVEIRGKPYTATVVPKPIYRKQP
jgi:aminomethyltransferase